MTIRLATPDEAAAVSYLVDAAYSKWIRIIGRKPAPMLANYAILIHQHYVFILTLNDQLAAVLVIWPIEGALYIDNVAVHPDYQRQGLGEKLLDFAEQKAREANLPMLRLLTNEKMTANQDYYHKRGYQETRREPLKDGGQVVWMHKPVSPDNKEQN